MNSGSGHCWNWRRRRPSARSCRAPAWPAFSNVITCDGTRRTKCLLRFEPRPYSSHRARWRRRSATFTLLLPRLRLVHAQRADCAAHIDRLLAALQTEIPPGPHREHHDVEILCSLPGVGRLVAATVLAEAAPLLAARAYHGLRTLAGCAPVTRQSGKFRGVRMRYGCNHRLQHATYHWARVSAQCDPHSRAHYTTLRQHGHSHPRALRGVADRLLAIFVAMLKTDTLYDATRPRRRELAA